LSGPARCRVGEGALGFLNELCFDAGVDHYVEEFGDACHFVDAFYCFFYLGDFLVDQHWLSPTPSRKTIIRSGKRPPHSFSKALKASMNIDSSWSPAPWASETLVRVKKRLNLLLTDAAIASTLLPPLALALLRPTTILG